MRSTMASVQRVIGLLTRGYRLTQDLQREFLGEQGYLPPNQKHMRAFAAACRAPAIVQQGVEQLRWWASAIVYPPAAQMGSPKWQVFNPESCLSGNRIFVITA